LEILHVLENENELPNDLLIHSMEDLDKRYKLLDECIKTHFEKGEFPELLKECELTILKKWVSKNINDISQVYSKLEMLKYKE
jgi:hypothetical protein